MSYTSLAIDYLYYIFSTTDKDTRQKEYHNLVKLYHEKISENIVAMGSDPEKLISFDDFQNELKRAGNFTLLVAPLLLQLSLTKSNNNETENGGDTEDREFRNAFNKRMSGVIDDCIDLGYYQRID